MASFQLWHTHPELIDGLYYRSGALRELQRFDEAHMALRLLLYLDPFWAPALLEQGLLRKGKMHIRQQFARFSERSRMVQA